MMDLHGEERTERTGLVLDFDVEDLDFEDLDLVATVASCSK